MDRYSILNGTTSGGVYDRLGVSKNLPAFLSGIGATSLVATTSKVESLLCGFAVMEGYHDQPPEEYPLAVRYAPLHLYKLPDFPKRMEAFCVLAICGLEHTQRDSVFSHTIYMSRPALQRKTDGHNFLDQIFGTHLTTHVDVAGHRSGKRPVNLEPAVKTCVPEMDPQDLGVVVRTIQAIYEEKVVILRLPKGALFNRRAFRLLSQIYSLMQPRLAVEVGFATYQDPAKIAPLANMTSTRIFVLPAEAKLDGLHLPNGVLLDLTDPKVTAPPEKNPLTEALSRWYRLSLEERLDCYQYLFDNDQINFLDPEKFIELTNRFWNDPFFQWQKECPDKGTFATLSQVLKKKQSFGICAIPGISKLFDQLVPQLLKTGSLQELTARAAVQALLGPDTAAGNADYMAGKKLGCPEVTVPAMQLLRQQMEQMSKESLSAQKARLDEQWTQQLALLEQKIRQMDQEMAQRDAQWQDRLTAAGAAAAEEKSRLEQTMADREEAHRQALLEKEGEKTEALRDRDAAHQKAMEEFRAQATQALTQERQNTADAKAHGAQVEETLTREQKDHETTRAQLAAEKAAHETAKANLTAAETARDQYMAQVDQVTRARKSEEAARKNAEEAREQAEKDLEAEQKAHEKTKKKLEEQRGPGFSKKALIQVAALGLAAGLLLMGIVWGCVALIGGGDPAPSAEPTETVLPAETNPPETTEPTETTTEPVAP